MKQLSEKEVMRHFKKYQREFISQLGSGITNSDQLTAIGKTQFGNKYIGTFPQDHPIKKAKGTQFYIINTDTSNQKGTHWCAVVSTPNNVFYLYDSFGRKSSKLLPIFTRGKFTIDTDYDKEQKKSENTCGVNCMAFLKCVENLGIKNALKI